MTNIFCVYQQIVEKALAENISAFGSKLQEAIHYALTQGGKRLRPALVMMVAKALDPSKEVIKAALASEYFHTASLLADDLPCMDNDQNRRGKPATHILYGESVAILASYALIAEGYRSIVENARALNVREVGMLAIDNVSYNAGIRGAALGQYLDLYPPRIDESTYIETAKKKTVALFEICFVLGWLFGGGAVEKLPLVKKAAYHYGMAFQMADDFDDASEDNAFERTMNAISIYGVEIATSKLYKELEEYLMCLKELQIDSEELVSLAPLLLATLPLLKSSLIFRNSPFYER